MSNSNVHADEIHNPGPLRDTAGLNTLLLVLSVIGIIAFLVGLSKDPTRAWAAFVLNHFFWLSMALTAAFFAAIQWLTSAMWSSPVRRLVEAMAAFLPFTLITFGLLYFGLHTLYQWSHPELVAHDLVMKNKLGYLSPRWFMIRDLGFMAILTLPAVMLIRNSLAQDKDGDYRWTRINKIISPPFIILYALLFSILGFDQMMSLDMHWYSTIFGVYIFAGAFYGQLGVLTLITLYFRKRGALGDLVNENHLHDLGKFLFGMVIFWAYIAFAQFMLTWYSNVPEETGWFIARMHERWFYIACFLVFGKFFLPFFVLLPRDAKRSVKVLTGVALFMVIAEWIDLLWIVQPNFYADGPRIGWIDIGVALGFIGIYGLVVVRFLSRHNMVAVRDPRIEESVFHHHQ